MSLFTRKERAERAAEARKRAGMIDVRELRRRCREAASIALPNFTPADRADAAAAAMARALGAAEYRPVRAHHSTAAKHRRQSKLTPYQRACIAQDLALPGDAYWRDCDAVSFTALYRDALDYRRQLLRRRERERASVERLQDEGKAEGLLPTVRGDYAEAPTLAHDATPDGAREFADTAARLLASAPDSVCDGPRYGNVWRYCYHAARAEKLALCAAELGCSVSALEQSVSRARATFRARYPDTADLLRGMLALLPLPDDTGEARRGHMQHGAAWSLREGRTGTDGGSPAPKRPRATEAPDAERAAELAEAKRALGYAPRHRNVGNGLERNR